MAGKRKIYTPEEKLEILARLESSGLGVTAFAEREGVSHGTLIAWRDGKKKVGKAKKAKGRTGPADPKMRIMAVEAYRKAGIPAREFAKTWGVGYSTLLSWVALYESKGPKALAGASLRAGAKKRGRKGIPQALREEIITAKRENPTYGLRKVRGFLKSIPRSGRSPEYN